MKVLLRTMFYDGILTITQQDTEEHNNIGQDVTDIIMSTISTMMI